MALLPSSSSPITNSFIYDAFISFRGEDTRLSFTGYLYNTLYGKGIHTFFDEKELHKGDVITPTLMEAIEKSEIFIIVLSKNYASSTFCLDELSKILDCAQKDHRLIYPIFYDVDPSDVRKQNGSFGEAMTLHMERFKDNKEKLQKWRTALQQVADLSGWHFEPESQSGHKLVEEIAEEVSKNIKRVILPVAAYPVGLKPRVKSVESLLDLGSGDKNLIVGIYGIGGIGKSTLALAIYNSIARTFQSSCFLQGVRENHEKHGIPYLQKILFAQLVGENKIEFPSPEQGISEIKRRLKQKKVLLILDDVDHEVQLRNLVGNPDLLGPGSRVIITTRNQQLLACHGVERTYKVEELKKKEATELFQWKAFKNEKVKSSYEDLLNQALSYASGLPLALEVIGSNLFGATRDEWESALEQYKRIPPKDIQKILEVSFDALEEGEKNVFLDIACCLKGYILKDIKDILRGHYGFCIENHIRVLVQKSLINITYWNEVTLHDLIEDMGKEIERQKSPNEPGKRSRLWFHEDIFDVLEQNTGTSTIEMIHLDYPSSEEVDWDGEGFKEMKQLKTLIIRKSHFSKGPKHLPNSLRVLEWLKYPSQDFPSDFHPKKLFIFKLPGSSLMSLELLSSKKLVTMKVLNLDECKYLREIPDLSSLPNLEELSFKDCENLITIDYSVGLLDKLKRLYARRCNGLKSFPPLKLPFLEELNLKECSSLESFPEILDKMETITELNLLGTRIKKFPSSFQNLIGLETLEVTNFPQPRSLVTMPPQLAYLTIGNHLYPNEEYLEEEEIEEMRSMLLSSKIETLQLSLNCLAHRSLNLVATLFPNLKELDVSWGKFTVLPECMRECRFLWKLDLDYCEQLREIEGIPPSLRELSAVGCSSLSFSSRSMLLEQELHEVGNTDFYLPSLEAGRIPEWFEYQSMDRSLLTVSFCFRNKFPRILLCLASPPSEYAMNNWQHYHHVVLTVNGIAISIPYNKEGHTRVVGVCPPIISLRYCKEGNTRVVGVSLPSDEPFDVNEWMELKITKKGQNSLDLRIGVHVLKENSSMEDIRFTNPNKKRKIDLNLPPLQEENDDVDTELTL